MKRFIDHDELARDKRFIRQANVAADILSQLPDDVDKVVTTTRLPVTSTRARSSGGNSR